jgi:poly(A) polymerase
MPYYSPLEETATQIVRKLRNLNYETYFAGGCVRDKIMNREPKDFDIATSATPREISALFPHTIPVGIAFGVVVVVEKGLQYEVATFRDDEGYSDGRHPDKIRFASALEDAKRRDFTLNGMFYDPIDDKIIDYVEGQNDIAQKKIRCIGDPETRFGEDHLRMLRAIRFAARFEFSIDENTFNAIKRNTNKILEVSSERIGAEITKMITSKGSGNAVRLMRKSGLLQEVLPEVDALAGVMQPEKFHPEGDVFEHTCILLDLLESPDVTLAWSALLHDIGKPATFYEAKDRIRFHNHARVGSLLAEKIGERLHFSNELIQNIKECVDNHMNFMNVLQMRPSTLKRLLRRPTFADELELHRLDCAASHGDLSNWNFLKEQISTLKEEEIKPEPLIRGEDLIKAGFMPGPIFKKILTEVENLQLENSISTPEEAVSWVINNYKVERGDLP